MSIEQILAIIVFAAIFIAIMWGKIHRYVPALIGANLAIALTFILWVSAFASAIVDNIPFGATM